MKVFFTCTVQDLSTQENSTGITRTSKEFPQIMVLLTGDKNLQILATSQFRRAKKSKIKSAAVSAPTSVLLRELFTKLHLCKLMQGNGVHQVLLTE